MTIRSIGESQITAGIVQNKNNELYDLDIQINSKIETMELVNNITSKSLCTPGCGNTGTGNSFCC